MSKSKLIFRRKKVKDHIIDCVNEDIVVLRSMAITRDILLRIKPPYFLDDEWVDRCRWIIHTIISQQFDKDRLIDNLHVEVYSVYLAKIIGKNYRIFLDQLIVHEIIECDEDYSIKQGKSYGYRVCGKYAKSAIGHSTLNDPRLRKAVIKHRMDQAAKLISKALPITPLTYWLTTGKLCIDIEEAMVFLRSYKSELKRVSRKYFKQGDKDGLINHEQFIEARYQLYLYQVEHWRRSFSIDNSGGRLYSALTNLPSPLRNFVTYDGQTLACIDIKNSQPFHFLFLLRSKFWKKYSKGLNIRKIQVQKSSKGFEVCDNAIREVCKLIKTISPNSMLIKSPQKIESQESNEFTFEKLVLSGKLYEFICERFNRKFFNSKGLDRFRNRKSSKQELLHMLYHNPRKRHSKQKEVFKEFSNLFPLEARIIDLMKEQDYRHFPILLQRIEAVMLLNIVPQMIYEASPDIPIFSIHDGIVVPVQHVSLVTSLIEEAYIRELGVAPSVEIKTFTELNAYEEKLDHIISKVEKIGPIQPNEFYGLMKFMESMETSRAKIRKDTIEAPDVLNYMIGPTLWQ